MSSHEAVDIAAGLYNLNYFLQAVHVSEWEDGINWGSESDTEAPDSILRFANKQPHTGAGVTLGFSRGRPDSHAQFGGPSADRTTAPTGAAASYLSGAIQHQSLVDAARVEPLPSGVFEARTLVFKPLVYKFYICCNSCEDGLLKLARDVGG